MAKTAVIIVAGGSGTRMGGSIPKQFIRVAGKEILVWTIEKFIKALGNPEIVVALPSGEMERWGGIAARNGLVGSHKVCEGGGNRFESVRNGIETLAESDCDYIAVHDGVRPLLSIHMIRECIRHAEKNGSAIPVIEPVDSFRIMENGNFKPVSRARLRSVQTPQVFRADVLRNAYEADNSPAFTDDASVVESVGGELSFCEGERRNIKITTHDDLTFANAVLTSRAE